MTLTAQETPTPRIYAAAPKATDVPDIRCALRYGSHGLGLTRAGESSSCVGGRAPFQPLRCQEHSPYGI